MQDDIPLSPSKKAAPSYYTYRPWPRSSAPKPVDFETNARTLHIRPLRAMRETLEASGAVFIPADAQFGPGVRLKAVEEPKAAVDADADAAETASQESEAG